MTAYGIILAGGNGERFWPISTTERPKQFVDLFEGKPLIRHAVDRLEGLIPPERILVITAERFVNLTREVLPMIPEENIIGEPCRRDTAAAVAVAVGLVKKLGGADAVGCILTADHIMTPIEAFRATLKDAIEAASRSDAIVTMGIVPTAPETGYGYIQVANAAGDTIGETVFCPVARFVEKPDLKTAESYLASGGYYWNSGMFVWKVATMAEAFVRHAPDIAGLIDAVASEKSTQAVLGETYPTTRAISVDFAVMEKAEKILVARCSFTWNDVGNWLSLPTFFAADQAGNTRLGRTVALETTGSIIVSDDTHPVAVLGLDNVVVVQTTNGTLVCAKDRVQEIKKLIKEL